MIFLTFLTAMALSGVAAYYSVIGLAAIFPGSFWPVVLMGSVLEGAKLVTVSWLYRNWKEIPILMKSYLVIATFILMLITSMGIFGYLSKAHLEHSSDAAPLVNKIALIDEKIKVSKENVDVNRKALKQMDEAVDQVMGRSSDEKGAEKAVVIRRGQQKERGRILTEIEAEQKKIGSLNEERMPMATEAQKTAADLGPIKYVAELIYGSGDADVVDKAVRLVIMLIMVVFDPLAVLLLIAANMSMQDRRVKEIVQKPNEELPPAPPIKEELVEEPESKKEETVEIRKDNMIIIDEATGESIPPITSSEQQLPKKLEPKYDYDEPYSFREKGK
jgi:hypothetical protein